MDKQVPADMTNVLQTEVSFTAAEMMIRQEAHDLVANVREELKYFIQQMEETVFSHVMAALEHGAHQ